MVSKFDQPCFIECMPMAASVPMTVEITVAITATEIVTCKADIMRESLNRRPYQSSVKPVHWARDSEALNDRPIITRMGR